MATANALDGMSRAEAAKAAKAAGMNRRALRDAVLRCNAEGVAGFHDKPVPGRPQALTKAELALLSERIFRGPDPETDGVSSRTLPDLCRWIEAQFAKRLTPQSLSRILRREGFSRRKTRPTHPKAAPEAQAAFEKGRPRRR